MPQSIIVRMDRETTEYLNDRDNALVIAQIGGALKDGQRADCMAHIMPHLTLILCKRKLANECGHKILADVK